MRLAFCWAHCRRYFYDFHQATGSPIAFEALRQIGQLYAVEAQIRGRPAEERLAARRERSRPIVDALQTWLTAQLERVSGKSSLAEAIRYALRHWTGWACSSTMAGSSSTPTSSSGHPAHRPGQEE